MIQVPLTDEQIKQIKDGVGESDDSYALLAEPKLNTNMLSVQVVTEKQYDILRPAILKAHKLPAWTPPKNGNAAHKSVRRLKT